MRHTLRLQYQSHNVTVSNKSLKICALCPPGRCTKKKKKSGRSYMKSACMYERSYTLKKRCAHYDCWQILYFFLLSIFLMDKMIKVNLVGTMVKLHHKSKRSTVAHHDFWYHTKKKKQSACYISSYYSVLLQELAWYTNGEQFGPSCAFSRYFTLAPFVTPAVSSDKTEHLAPSPLAMNKGGDLSSPFMCNVTSPYGLHSDWAGKDGGANCMGAAMGIFWGSGYIVLTARAKKNNKKKNGSYSSQCQSTRLSEVTPEGREEIHIWVSWDFGGHLGFQPWYTPTEETRKDRGDTKRFTFSKCTRF